REQLDDIVGKVLQREETGDREKAEQRRKQGEKKIVGQLRGEALRVVAHRFPGGPLDQFGPGQIHFEVGQHVRPRQYVRSSMTSATHLPRLAFRRSSVAPSMARAN